MSTVGTITEAHISDGGQHGHMQQEPREPEENTSPAPAPNIQGDAEAKETTLMDDQPRTSADTQARKEPWIGYRTEYRNRWDGELISDETHPKGNKPTVDPVDGPIFELITAYKVMRSSSNMPLSASSQTLPTYEIRIYSTALIHAIQSVVRYYPSQDLSGEYIAIKKPYPILVHHYDLLQDFRRSCLSKPQSELCIREHDAAEHLRILLEFLDEEVMEGVRAEQERNKRGFSTFEWRWVAFRPGVTVVQTTTVGGWMASVVHSVSGGVFETPHQNWRIATWGLDYVGDSIQRVWLSESIWYPFDGEKADNKEIRFFDPTADDAFLEDDQALALIGTGKRFVEMIQKRCYHHKGKAASFPHNEIDGLAMVDLNAYYTIYPPPDAMGEDDLRNWATECTCTVCEKQRGNSGKAMKSLFGDFGDIYFYTSPAKVPDHEFLLCPSVVDAYIFRTRTWEKLRIRNLMEPQFDEDLISNLVMSPSRLNTLKALSKSFARVNKHGEEINESQWSADFVRGKGNGLIFLLHGKPGVGKTCTAECIAEFTQRPLMVLTSSDIGTDPEQVESHLTTNFKRAMSWGAVLLIDEADVFMERRTTSDLTRNSLVAGFLRALEFYDGILFLTTNRVGSFDDAFISRIHVQLYYPEFTDDERQQVWNTFIKKLGRERGKTMRLTLDAKDYIKSTSKHGLKWNGREIRNAFQTAVALAEYDAEKDEEGKIMVTDNHLRAVVELSQDFKGYMEELHRGDEAKRAERSYERLDSWPTQR